MYIKLSCNFFKDDDLFELTEGLMFQNKLISLNLNFS